LQFPSYAFRTGRISILLNGYSETQQVALREHIWSVRP
jgi:hypothetical protein